MFKLDKLIVLSSFLVTIAGGCSAELDSDTDLQPTSASQDAPDPVECAEVADRLHNGCGIQLVADDENETFLVCEAGAFTAEELQCLRTAPCGDIAATCFDITE